MERTFDLKDTTARAGDRRPGRSNRARVALVVAASVLVSACTALPDWADPGGWFEEDTPPPSRISAAKDLDQAKSGVFPNLSSVPDKPRAATPVGERAAIAKGLAADRANAQYSGERLVAGGAAAPAAPAIAQDLGAAPLRAPSATRSVPVPAPPPQSPVPAPAQTQSLPPIPAPSQSQASAPAPEALGAIRAGAAPQAAQARTSELAAIIYFANGSDALNANDRSVLRDVVAISRERDARIRVIGHASARTGTVDPIKHRMANLEISQRRAEAVAAALVRFGVARERVRTEARSDTLPVYHEFMPSGEAGNRRAEIFLEY